MLAGEVMPIKIDYSDYPEFNQQVKYIFAFHKISLYRIFLSMLIVECFTIYFAAIKLVIVFAWFL